jgi:hypothetical protein
MEKILGTIEQQNRKGAAMDSSKTESTDGITKDGKPPKRGQRISDRRQLEEIFRLAIVQVKVWFVLSVIAAILVFGFGMVTTATIAATDISTIPNPVSLIITAISGLINALFLVQLRAANKRVDTIRDMLFGGK